MLLLITGVEVLKGKDKWELRISITVGRGQVHTQAYELCFCSLLFFSVSCCSLTTTVLGTSVLCLRCQTQTTHFLSSLSLAADCRQHMTFIMLWYRQERLLSLNCSQNFWENKSSLANVRTERCSVTISPFSQ